MSPTPLAPSRLLALAVALAAAGCQRCGGGQAGPPPLSTTEAVLATLPPKWAAAGHGHEGPQVDPVVNAAGTGGALVVDTGDGVHVVHGGAVSGRYVAVHEVAISPDGARVACLVSAGDKVRVVVDGEVGPDLDGAQGLVFTPDGRHLAYLVRQGPAWRLALDRALGPPQAMIHGPVHVTADGATLVTVEAPTADPRLVVAAYDLTLRRREVKGLAATRLVLDAAATRGAAVVDAGGRQAVVAFPLSDPSAEARVGDPFDAVRAVDFDPTGRHVIIAGSRAGALLLALDGRAEPLPAPTIAERPVVNGVRGSLAVILAGDGTFFLHVLFDPRAPAEKRYAVASGPAVSPDGRRYAWAAEAGGRRFVVVDGVEGEPFDDVSPPIFGPGSSHLAYRAQQGRARYLVIADASGRTLRRAGPFLRVLEPAFTPDGRAVAFAALEGPRLTWKVERLEP